MTTKNKLVIVFILGMISGIFLIAQFAFKENREQEKLAASKNFYYAPKLPASISLFGENVPLDRQDVRESFDRELIYNMYSQGHMIYLIKLSKKYFPMIEERLRANGLPDDFKYLCVAESNLQNLVSRVGASGFWQFMKTTAPGYKLEVNDHVDERYEVMKSTDAACQYLKTAYAKFGSWTAAAASYNCGMGGYNNFATQQQTKYYYDLLLPDETNKYIFRILSFKHIIGNAPALGFIVETDDLYTDVQTKTINITSSINDLAVWAIANGTTYKMVKRLNPWLRSKSLPVSPGKSYQLKLPQ